MATCVQAGVNAMDYLVALQENRSAVFAHPAGWLPWTDQSEVAGPSSRPASPILRHRRRLWIAIPQDNRQFSGR